MISAVLYNGFVVQKWLSSLYITVNILPFSHQQPESLILSSAHYNATKCTQDL
jgi:hypothetical protein